MERCQQCGLKIRGGGTTTATGRRLCPTCGDAFVGAAVGVLQGSDAIAAAVALGHSKGPGTSGGILGWIRRALGRG